MTAGMEAIAAHRVARILQIETTAQKRALQSVISNTLLVCATAQGSGSGFYNVNSRFT